MVSGCGEGGLVGDGYMGTGFPFGVREDFPGSPVVKTPHFQCRAFGFDPGTRSHMSQLKTQPSQKKR